MPIATRASLSDRANWTLPWVGACTLLGLALRALVASRDCLWHDEAQFLYIVRSESIGEMFRFLRLYESHPPLFYLMMRAWLTIFGDSQRSAQALTVLLGAAIVPALEFVGRRMFNRRTGAVAALLGATAPMLIHFSTQVRPYSLLPLLCLLSTYALWSGLRKGSLIAWGTYVISTLAMLLVHNWSWLVLAGHWPAALGWMATHPTQWREIRAWCLCQATIALAFAPWLPSFLYQVHHAGYDGAMTWSSYYEAAIYLLPEVTLGLDARRLTWVIYLVIGVVLADAVLRHRYRIGIAEEADAARTRTGLAFLVVVPLVAFIAVGVLSRGSNLLHDRCVLTLGPCLLVALSGGITALPRRVAAPLVFAGALTILNLRTDLFDLAHVRPRSNAREMAAAVAERARPGDLILVSPEWDASSFKYYYPRETLQIAYPTEDFQGAIRYDDTRRRMLDPVRFDRLRKRLEDAHRKGRRVWFLTERDLPRIDVPDPDDSSALGAFSQYPLVGYARAIQIRRLLTKLFGPPDDAGIPIDKRIGSRRGHELLRVNLFSEIR